ncbi:MULTISPECIES: glycosyltransferase [unclassified Brenneria]|uniref:tetratricopeptide repeat-containing glycosyltransferase family 2 protein n=1 Tax=unclassified Brenneria TaxID=2634434 RepID=UPI0029C4D3C9|nr:MULTISPECIES: glycosyltransferase [unclassified Brenneria]MDX5630731.1 glycosyltransferase [Brenneria sp. L3-3Z]MDX5694217.1 glycosyltransferase [Brenneria sp. L4-2C]
MQNLQNPANDNDPIMISVCMIVKDEAQHLENSLRALAQYFDDIVVVDTGSTDRSKQIAGRFTNKIYDFPWISDFSAARNYSLQFAKYDWVLVVDADEELDKIDIALLLEQISSYSTNVGTVEIISITNDESASEKDFIKERVSRLFDKSHYEFFGIIHEQICKKTTDEIPDGRFDAPLSFIHSGYTKDIIESKDKINRNIVLLQRAIDKSKDDPYLHYQLGKSYYLGKNYALAEKSFEASLHLQKERYHDYNEVLIECYGYCLINTAQYKKALDILKYEDYCPSTDFMFLKALILMNNADFQSAIDTFQLCTRMEAGRKKGVNTYKANYNIAVILECFGMMPQALEYYQKCGDYKLALEGINRVR